MHGRQHTTATMERQLTTLVPCGGRSLKKDAKLKEKKSKAWKQRQGEQKQAQAKKQKKYVHLLPSIPSCLPSKTTCHICSTLARCAPNTAVHFGLA